MFNASSCFSLGGGSSDLSHSSETAGYSCLGTVPFDVGKHCRTTWYKLLAQLRSFGNLEHLDWGRKLTETNCFANLAVHYRPCKPLKRSCSAPSLGQNLLICHFGNWLSVWWSSIQVLHRCLCLIVGDKETDQAQNKVVSARRCGWISNTHPLTIKPPNTLGSSTDIDETCGTTSNHHVVIQSVVELSAAVEVAH